MNNKELRFQVLIGQNWVNITDDDHMLEELTTWVLEAKPQKYDTYEATYTNGCTYRLLSENK
jgi:methyl coenzyme M reductase subunit D